ncbi:uncharacterized protein LOC111642294 [Centruroides sculpturatus]|uniref:uncharacterized protein LOC111642294 n=1 Tax=Centruroides sculpturatus TaxID=218467 RepID=UPI000C6D6230|nr:uncharacterized protein LOC111642294 [Centruroides sculpturatus]
MANLVPIHLKIKYISWIWNIQNEDLNNNETISAQTNTQDDFHHSCQDIIHMTQAYGLDNQFSSIEYNHHPATKDTISINLLSNTTTTNHVNWHVYTDGAKNDKGTGAAFTIWDTVNNTTSKEEYHKLGNHCSNNQAELWAMQQALITITKHLRIYQGNIDFFTDSRYVLSVLNGTTKQTATGIRVCYLANNLHKKRNISFNWIPGHSGIAGNERADALAKEVTTLNVTPSFKKIPITLVKSLIHDKIMNEWQKDWTNSNTGRITYRFLPSVKDRQQLHHFFPTYGITQCITGHGNFPAYLTRFGKRDKENCDCDNTSKGDSLHYLLDCPNLDSERYKLFSHSINKGQNWPPKLDYLCANKEAFHLLINFINSCNIFQTNSSNKRH